jgi:hypothetical protein
MSRTLERIRELVAGREVQISDHGYEEEIMSSHHHTKLVHEGRYAAEVEVDLIDADRGWSPYLSLSDAQKLDEVRRALRGGDLKRASQLARVFQLLPVNI